MKKVILVTAGEIAGIGPNICLDLAFKLQPHHNYIVIIIGCTESLKLRARLLNINNIEFINVDHNHLQNYKNMPGKLLIINTPSLNPGSIGVIDIKNTPYVIQTLDTAINLCKNNKAHAIVTAPISKESINQFGIKFSGHTEYFAQKYEIEKVVMMLGNDRLNIALATTHLPLRQVADHITYDNIDTTIKIIHDSFNKLFGIAKPRIGVCGLNPHAGEGGYLGTEEIETINPVIEKWQQNNYKVYGSYPADTIFNEAHQFDVILAMYHDQGLPVLKYSDFINSINITLGLPILRTSVDHGTALNIAKTNNASSTSLLNAIKFIFKYHH